MATPHITGNTGSKKFPFIDVNRTKTQSSEDIRPMTMAEYNAMIDEAEEDYRASRYISHEEMGKRIASWR
jgi:hypothetical protein